MVHPREIVQSLYEAFGRGDVEAVLAVLHPEIVWLEAESNPYADRNPYRGPLQVAEGLFARLGSEWDGFAVHPDAFVAEGERVVALGRYTGTHGGTKRPLDAQFVHAWTIQGGRVTAFQQYTDTAQFQRVMGRS